MSARSLPASRLELSSRLRAREKEIEGVVLTRVYSISDLELEDSTYAAGLRAAVSAALSYGFAGIEQNDVQPRAIPAELFAQARNAARNGVPLDTVIRRYLAGHTLLNDFVMQEAKQGGVFGLELLQDLSATQSLLVDRLIAVISDEYRREAQPRPLSSAHRKAERVRQLLGGELVECSELEYDLRAHHLGAVAVGDGGDGAMRDLAAELDRRLLLVEADQSVSWAWLGGHQALDPEASKHLSTVVGDDAKVALGEPGHGLDGWRLTHRQALAALPIARSRAERIVRYADVALAASMVQDDLLAGSLHRIYLAPLAGERDGGAALRLTLRAYLAADRNISSTAAILKVSRRTVANRLHAAEERIGRPLASALTEIDAALRLDDLGGDGSDRDEGDIWFPITQH